MMGPKHVQDARRHLEKTALKYARIKTFGADLEERQLNDGTWITQWTRYDVHDVDTLSTYQLGLLGDAACTLLRELAVYGEVKELDNPFACRLQEGHAGSHECEPEALVSAAKLPNRCLYVY